MNKIVFEFNNYRPYLLSKLGSAGQRTGLRARACKALGCHATYLSQVLTGKVELSLEHAEAFNRFLSHKNDEADFFILLVLKERSGSALLRDRFQSQIDTIKAQRKSLKGRINEVSDISLDEQEMFYGSWVYGALHVLCSLPRLSSSKEIAEVIGLSLGRVENALEFLEKIGLVAITAKGFEIGPRHIHLSHDSKFIKNHHSNWRIHAVHSLDDPSRDDLHYSGAISLSKQGANIFRENLLKLFQENMQIVQDAKEEVAYVYNFDFYRLDK